MTLRRIAGAALGLALLLPVTAAAQAPVQHDRVHQPPDQRAGRPERRVPAGDVAARRRARPRQRLRRGLRLVRRDRGQRARLGLFRLPVVSVPEPPGERVQRRPGRSGSRWSRSRSARTGTATTATVRGTATARTGTGDPRTGGTARPPAALPAGRAAVHRVPRQRALERQPPALGQQQPQRPPPAERARCSVRTTVRRSST